MHGEREEGLAPWLVAALLFAAALALRLVNLGAESPWHDEAFTILVARQGFGAMVEDLVRDFNHPPLHYVLVHLVFRVVEPGLLAARLPSAVLGAAATPALYLLGRRLYDPRTALLAASLLALSQQMIVWSQTARGYAQLVTFSVVAVHLFVVALRELEARPARARLAWIGAVVAATLGLYSHFYAVFVVAACLVFLILSRRRYALPLSWMGGGLAFAVFAYLPWLLSGVVGEARGGRTPFAEQSVWRRSDLLSIPETIDAFDGGRVAGAVEDPPLVGLVVAGLLHAVPAAIALSVLARRRGERRTAREREAATLLGLSVALPILAAWALGYLGLAYRVRYVAFALPPYLLLVARGLVALRPPLLRRAAVVLCLAWGALAAGVALFAPYRAQYAGALELVEERWRDGDVLVFSPWGEPRQWQILREEHPDLETAPFPALAGGGLDGERAWLLSYLKPGARGRTYRHLEQVLEQWRVVDHVHLYRVDVRLLEPDP